MQEAIIGDLYVLTNKNGSPKGVNNSNNKFNS